MAAVMIAVAAGCGSNDAPTETTPSLSKAAFVQQADAICRNARDEIIKAIAKIPRHGEPRVREKIERGLISSVLIPALEEEVDRLRALGAPAGDAAAIEQILKLAEGAIDEAKTEPESYVGGEEYRSGSEHYGRANQLARRYGMKDCIVN
jgi:hypothetical protein